MSFKKKDVGGGGGEIPYKIQEKGGLKENKLINISRAFSYLKFLRLNQVLRTVKEETVVKSV